MLSEVVLRLANGNEIICTRKGVSKMEATTREAIVSLLRSTKREGMDSMIDWLVDKGFFTSPASIKFHGSHKGGLAEHSLGVYYLLGNFVNEGSIEPCYHGPRPLPVTRENLIIAPLLHDICKVGAYLEKPGGYKWNRAQPKGHALLSIIRCYEHIKLEPIEELMIKFHMGVYGLYEYDPVKHFGSEYHLCSDGTGTSEERYGKTLRNAWFHNPIVKYMYFCDEFESAGVKGGQ